MVAPEKGYSPKSVYWYQCFSIWKKVDGESLVHDKVFELKNIFCKNSYIFFKNYPIENIFVLNSSPKYCNGNMQKKVATKKSFRKTVYDKVFKVWAKKVTFIKQIVVPLKQSISHKSVHWYQCFSLWKMLDGVCLGHDKEFFLF